MTKFSWWNQRNFAHYSLRLEQGVLSVIAEESGRSSCDEVPPEDLVPARSFSVSANK